MNHIREQIFRKLSENEHDVIIVGGGIAGAGILRDAAMRGMDAILLEKRDFASGTTAGSTKMAHGGIRYLPQLEFPLLIEALRERDIITTLAPHLAREIAFIYPIYRGDKGGIPLIKTGMFLYDFLDYIGNLYLFDRHGSVMNYLRFYLSKKRHRMLKPDEVLEKVPGLRKEGLIGGAMYYDCQIDPERLCLENILDGIHRGGVAINYTRCIKLLRGEGKVVGVVVKDEITGEEYQVIGKRVINAAGPWCDEIRHLYDTALQPKIRGSKGIHLFVKKFTDHAAALPTEDKRAFFVIPWYDFSLVGTTDTHYDGSLDEIPTTQEDARLLLDEINRAFPELNLKLEDVIYSYARIRPLVVARADRYSRIKNAIRRPGKRTSAISRKHEIFDHMEIEGFISVAGVKLTSYRDAAQQVVDIIQRRIGRRTPCTTHKTPFFPELHGTYEKVEEFIKTTAPAEAARYGVERETVELLIRNYGARFREILALTEENPSWKEKICANHTDILAQVIHAARNELAVTPGDFLLRRCLIGRSKCLGLDCVETVAKTMGGILGWTEHQRKAQIENYRNEVQRTLQIQS